MVNRVGDDEPNLNAAARERTFSLGPDKTGVDREIRVAAFGEPGARPKAYLQTALHADELPGMLVLRRLIQELSAAADRGDILGEIVITPVANPIGLAQIEGGYMQGRVERATGRNFNRGFPDLAGLVGGWIGGDLGADPAANVARIRAAMAEALETIRPRDAFEALQLTLIGLAHDADFCLDLHADNEALVHMYVGAASWPDAADLAADIDARAVLLCDNSGAFPFDEACGAPWRTLANDFPEAAIPPACLSATLELRSNNSVSSRLADRDARAIFRFLTRRGLVKGESETPPRLLARATPLTAAQHLKAPIEGLIDYRAQLGDTLRTGDVVATIVPPFGAPVDVQAETDGLLFARHDQTWAWPDKTIGKIAGTQPLSDGSKGRLTP